MMAEQNMQEFIKVLSSKAAVPGGGGACAYVAAAGMALGAMVANLTTGKKKYAQYQEEIEELLSKTEQLSKELMTYMDKDAESFEPLSKAYGLPKDTKEQQEYKDVVMEKALKEAEVPIRQFMYGQVQRKDVKLFVDMAGDSYDIDSAALEKEYEESGQSAYDAIPMTIMIPSFIIGELRQAFIMGFVIYVPFIVIDMVVASVLMSMGMMMLPPTTISLPFKILLFILADGWNLVIGSVVKTFY